ncbi:MAG: class I SAM-dependent methyltransferase [Bacilli bacterium]
MRLLAFFVRQSGNPSGIVGKVMTVIMNAIDSGLTAWAVENLQHTKGKILEIGCGGGSTLHALEKNGIGEHLFGIDYSVDALEIARKKNIKNIQSGKITLQHASAENLPFPDNHFSSVLALRTHYFWSDLVKSCDEIHRVLHNGGSLLILPEKYKIQYHMKQYNTDETISALLYAIGFNHVEIEHRDTTLCITATK